MHTTTKPTVRWVDPAWLWVWEQVQPFIRYRFGALPLDVLATALGMLTPLLLKHLIDDVLPHRRWDGLALVALAYFGANFGQAVLRSCAALMGSAGLMATVCHVRLRLLNRVVSLSPPFFDRYPVGDLVQRVEQDVSAVAAIGSDVAPSVVRFGVQIIITFAIVLYLDAWLVLVLLPLLPLYSMLRRRFAPRLRANSERVREAWGTQSSLLHELLAGVLQVQLLGQERRLARRYGRMNLRTQRASWKGQTTETWYRLGRLGLISLTSAIIVGFGGMRVLNGSLTPGGVARLLGYVGGMLAPISSMGELFVQVTRVRANVTRLRDLEQMSGDVAEPPTAVPLVAPPRILRCANVTFGYHPDVCTFSGVDFEVLAGERVALVGRSGCGKSTLLKLIPRLYDPDEGRIELDGIDIRGLQVRSVRDAISFVPQEPVLFRGTLRDNLRQGGPFATPDEIERAVSMACLHEVVARFPDGLGARLGPMGRGLSVGEKQRMAIARAILQDRPILILDEATSALDAATEQELLTRLEPWCANRIVIVVSHRRSAAEWADRVVMLESGQVVESGSHAALYRPGSRYFEMWHREHPIPR